MAFHYDGREYTSKKFPILIHIFNKKISEGEQIGDNILFTLNDISEGYSACGIQEPASISNTILDLTRQDRGIERRIPEEIFSHGYDLRKRTGPSPMNGENLAGEFVFVGVGETLKSWLSWPEEPDRVVTVPNKIPASILESGLLGKDEGALFSVIDYCDVLSHAIYNEDRTVYRVQNPKKWQPNEIDGLYISDKHNSVFVCEAKALSTGDEINLEQMRGGYLTAVNRMPEANIIPVALVMAQTGVNIAILGFDEDDNFFIEEGIQAIIDPTIDTWI